MPEPHLILEAIENDCALLDALEKLLDTKGHELEIAEERYEDAFEGELAVLVEEYEIAGSRLPGEEVRRALIHKRIDRALYRTVKRLKTEVSMIEKRGRMTCQALSGRQSELSWLRAEGQAAVADSGVTWSKRAA